MKCICQVLRYFRFQSESCNTKTLCKLGIGDMRFSSVWISIKILNLCWSSQLFPIQLNLRMNLDDRISESFNYFPFSVLLIGLDWIVKLTSVEITVWTTEYVRWMQHRAIIRNVNVRSISKVTSVRSTTDVKTVVQIRIIARFTVTTAVDASKTRRITRKCANVMESGKESHAICWHASTVNAENVERIHQLKVVCKF